MPPLKQSPPSGKELQPRPRVYGMLVLAASAFVSPAASIVHTAFDCLLHCCHNRSIEYEDFLDRNFDGERNITSPFVQVYLSSKSNNETYTIKEMIQNSDNTEFLKLMEAEVSYMFRDKIWEMVLREDMINHYHR